MAVKTYNPDEVVIIFGGNIISGYADGSFVNVARDENSFTKTIGSNGEGVRSRTNNNGGTITLTLLQSSASNDVLSALMAADELTGAGAAPLLIKDNSGSSLYSAETAWINKPADSEFAREAGSREWVLETDFLVMNVGGN